MESMSTREIPFLLCLLTSKTVIFFTPAVVNYSDFANNPNKDEIKELLQPRSLSFGRGVASATSRAGALRPWSRFGSLQLSIYAKFPYPVC